MTDDTKAGSGPGGAWRVDYPEWLGETERRLIDQGFAAFAWRTKPEAIVGTWAGKAGSAEAAENLLAGVDVRHLDDELFDVALPNAWAARLSLTPEANLYYMPALIARCVREIERQGQRCFPGYLDGPASHFASSMLLDIRSRPYNMGWPVSAWPRFLDAAAGDEDALADPEVAAEVAECGRGFLMETTRYWLMVAAPGRAYGRTWRDTLDFVARMTMAERQALAAFFGHLATAKVWSEEPDIASARALLAGRGVMDVLRIRTAAECIEIADALQALETRHPLDFPRQEVALVKNLLRDIAAGRRSPDTRLGW